MSYYKYKLNRVLWLVLLLLIIMVGGTAHAQDAPVCPEGVGCAEIILSPETMFGDIFVGDQGVAGGQNRVIVQVTPGQAVTITARNIQNPGEEGFGELFVYQETSVTVNVAAGQTRAYTLRPVREFIRGTLAHTCNVNRLQEGEDVQCQIIIDGADRGVVPSGERREFTIDPGERALRVQLVGGSVSLYEPTVRDSTFSITAGRTTTVNTTFERRARLIINLNQEGVFGDIFVNDQLVAGQSPSAELFVTPNEGLNIAVRNINDPAANGDYRWLDAETSTTISPGQERTVTVTLRQEPLRGTLAHTCNVSRLQQGEDVQCQIIIDGADRGVVPSGERREFTIDPGERALRVQLVGGSVSLYEPTARDSTFSITAGRTTTVNTTFERLARLIVTINEEGAVGDIFVNDQLIAGQSPRAELFVTPNERLNIAVRNINSPNAVTYRLEDAETSTTIGAGQERTITARPQRVDLISRERLNALDSIETRLNSTRTAWDTIQAIWRPLANGEFVFCGNYPRVPSELTLNAGLLEREPGVAEALNALNAGIRETRRAVDEWRSECSIPRQFVPVESVNSGVAAVNNAEASFNQTQGAIDTWRVNP